MNKLILMIQIASSIAKLIVKDVNVKKKKILKHKLKIFINLHKLLYEINLRIKHSEIKNSKNI